MRASLWNFGISTVLLLWRYKMKLIFFNYFKESKNMVVEK